MSPSPNGLWRFAFVDTAKMCVHNRYAGQMSALMIVPISLGLGFGAGWLACKFYKR